MAFFSGSRRACILGSMFAFALLAGGAAVFADDTPANSPTTAPSEGGTAGTNELAPVTVTANRIPTRASEVGSSISVISGQDLEREQVPFVADALRYVPSVNVTRSGGPGQITSVFTRGANSDHTLVLIDGIEANDPTSPSRAFDFSTLTVDDIDRIEVLRGPQSTLWGSNAIGGVINIITRRGEGKPTGYAYAEGGSFNTFREGVGSSGSFKAFNYSFSLTQQDSQGISAADSKFGNREPDGYGITSLAGRFGYTVSENLDIDFITRYQHGEVDIDNGGGPGNDDPHRRLRSNTAFFRVQPRVTLFDGKWIQTYGFNYSYYDRRDTSLQFPSHSTGGILKFDWQNDFKLCDCDTLTAGLALSQENINATDPRHKSDDAEGYFLQDAVNFRNSLFLTGGLRYDHLTVGGSDLTYRFTGAYILPTHTTLRSSYGTGFKAPSLSDLYSSFGSPTLKPETSEGWDAGIEQAFFDNRLVLQATYFANNFSNLIDFNFITNREDNIGRARARGVETGLTYRPIDAITVGLTYTHTDTEDFSTHDGLLRRPPNSVSAQVTWDYSKRGQVTVGAVYESSRLDINPVSFSNTRTPGYVVANLSTSYKLTDYATLTARFENLFNQHYEEVAGFGEPGFAAYGGLRLTF